MLSFCCFPSDGGCRRIRNIYSVLFPRGQSDHQRQNNVLQGRAAGALLPLSLALMSTNEWKAPKRAATKNACLVDHYPACPAAAAAHFERRSVCLFRSFSHRVSHYLDLSSMQTPERHMACHPRLVGQFKSSLCWISPVSWQQMIEAALTIDARPLLSPPHSPQPSESLALDPPVERRATAPVNVDRR